MSKSSANELAVFSLGEGGQVSYNADGLVSLTDLWKAAGEDPKKKPVLWYANDFAKEFVEALSEKFKVGIPTLWKSRRGKGLGGTWAHWQVAMAYCKWLKPEFHIHVNEAYIRWTEEEKNPGLKLDRAVDKLKKRGKSDSWIRMRLDTKLVRNQFTSTLKDHNVVERDTYRRATNTINMVVTGKTPHEYLPADRLSGGESRRDHMSTAELNGLGLVESASTDLIKATAADGDTQCLNCVNQVADLFREPFRQLRAMTKTISK